MQLKDLPKELRKLSWERCKENQQWTDGDYILAAVPMKHTGKPEINYVLGVVTLSMRENDDGDAWFDVLLDGEDWGIEPDSIEMFVRLD